MESKASIRQDSARCRDLDTRSHRNFNTRSRRLKYVEDYRVSQQVLDLGWVDFDFNCSTVSHILPGLM